MTDRVRIGLISDTHGLLRPEALSFLSGSDLIIHGGDIGGPEILGSLGQVAPTRAVRGNNDVGAWADALEEILTLTVSGVTLLAVHDLKTLTVDPALAGIRVVISGHSHKPALEQRGPVLFVNPGSAGPRRFSLPLCVGELNMVGAQVSGRLVQLG